MPHSLEPLDEPVVQETAYAPHVWLNTMTGEARLFVPGSQPRAEGGLPDHDYKDLGQVTLLRLYVAT